MRCHFPVIDLVRTGENIKRIAKERGISADRIKDMLAISDRSNIYNSVEGCPPPIGGGNKLCSVAVDNLLTLSILFDVTINERIIVEKTEKAA